MNPLNYLHLANTKPEVDIRGSQIGVYYRFDQNNLKSSTIVMNFQDGRWRKVVEQPIARIKEALEDKEREDSGRDPFYLQTVFLTSIFRWWSNALNSFNDQLIAYEEKMLAEEQATNISFSTLNSETSRALHCMTAHLHRYGSELVLLSGIVQDIREYNIESHGKLVTYGVRSSNSLKCIKRSMDQITTHLSSISQFREELQLKIDNVLSLLVDNTQIMNERLLIENSKTMQSILQATQAEAEQSRQLTAKSQELTNEINMILHSTNEETKASLQMARQTQRLSEEMMKDSVYMKTIALLTVLFLPGTSFAAILSMSFFDEDKWMHNVSRFWLWIALTVPTTALCFAFYVVWGRKEAGRKKVLQDEDENV
ncbi:hypothetical protein K469DRAFT_36556 [Zopfia rhizophila CBS 207.26]|uniref:Cora-domain-containing protein n=1 Tax=Zopfia rhizophila CBS 207.26 TaxID=1314779 RepID=A0A6A6DDY2_9PEZI|nr:hypothetical protein K469DRAFT_36556 [Zopfia rhizophila CBS 207.26]